MNQIRIFTPKNPFPYLCYIVIILFIFNNISYSQTDIPTDTVKVDSAQAEKLGLFNKENKKTFKIIFSGNPGKAALYSLIVPGGGQAYNKRYWKIPIVWIAVGWVGYLAIQGNNEYKKANNVYKCLLKGELCDYNGITSATQLRPYRDQLRSSRERKWVTFGIIYLVQSIEAYIDRHLIDFDLEEDLSFKQNFENGSVNFGFSLNLSKQSKKLSNRKLLF